MVESKRLAKVLFRVTHRTTGVSGHCYATTSENACKLFGVTPGDAFINQVLPDRKKDWDGKVKSLYRVPCQTCPFQFAQCCLPRGGDCLVKTDVPDVTTWLKNVTEAHLCTFVGKPLAKKDYESHQVWLTTPEVVQLLDAP